MFAIIAPISSGERLRHRSGTSATHALMSSSIITIASSAKCRTIQFRTVLIPRTSSGMVSSRGVIGTPSMAIQAYSGRSISVTMIVADGKSR